ncbi:cryptochrome [Cylindrobasidium torrendii FP15055 ss-10]|uniref:Cryptochrome DASH n=1 Tax=Cylindrobasidium torrendii FP15055 ss-10 TaxID=1314674 RepID=A0A0D7B5C0_9AGAR|nr:cryptochrome [Cylindrobasidium torrendii FP15055 ss-10]
MFLIYVLRHDLRFADNPIFHAIAAHQPKITHILPLYVLAPHQIEVSGFLEDTNAKSPFPETRSQIGRFWRCGPHRARWIAESVWDLKETLKKKGSDVVVRAGRLEDVVKDIIESKALKDEEGAVWMTRDWATEERAEELRMRRVVTDAGLRWKVWDSQETLIHDKDLGHDATEVADVFSTFRKSVEPLRDHIREPLPEPTSLPPLPDIPPQQKPFSIPESLEDFIDCLQKPLGGAPPKPRYNANPAVGGEQHAQKRLQHLVSTGAMSRYKDTRNGMVNEDDSTKLAGYLAMGSISARQINAALVAFEEGKLDEVAKAQGYGKGENKGTAAVRFELLWRDYMCLCMRKYGSALFSLYGFHGRQDDKEWLHPSSNAGAAKKLRRFLDGTTGIGLIDASMRELKATGYTSNRARQNCASFLALWLGIDWRLGAEWYESQLADYDVANNWANWQYVAGVGNDPRARRFNPVKQAYDYDPKGEYVKLWVDEVAEVDDLDVVFQPWKLKGAQEPLAKISYHKRK